jgi:hypothetical protein
LISVPAACQGIFARPFGYERQAPNYQ